MNITKRALGLLAVAGLAASGAVLATPAAQAATVSASAATAKHHSGVVPNAYGTFDNSVWENGVNIRSGPGTGYSIPGQAQTGQTLIDYCYTTGTIINGNPFWDKITDANTGVSGYVTEYYLNDMSQTKHC